jgi:hypothetical protein
MPARAGNSSLLLSPGSINLHYVIDISLSFVVFFNDVGFLSVISILSFS